MANKQIVDLNDIVQDTASGDFLVIYDLSGTEDKKISFDDLAQKIFDEFGVTATVAELNILDGVTSTAAELNILDGVTATYEEINTLDGIKSTVDELNLLDEDENTSVFDSGGIVLQVDGDIQVKVTNGAMTPNVDNDVSLGGSSFRYNNLDIAGTTLLEGVVALDGTPQDVTSLSTTINATTSRTNVESGVGALAMDIENGNYEGQLKYVCMIEDGGGTATLTGANLAGTSIAMDNIGEGFTLIWDDGTSDWYVVGNNDCAYTA
jgi:hypothetical protein